MQVPVDSVLRLIRRLRCHLDMAAFIRFPLATDLRPTTEGQLVNIHVLAEYAPPRSWDQFEELCADVFQSAFDDPALVRHGRAGQRQHGVDIVARHGALYPIGLQCKRRSRWPVAKVTKAQIDAEVAEALKFTPALKAFYILTTAPSDTALLKHVRTINERHRKQKLFEIVLLGWDEIVRRATRFAAVADKHFGPTGGGALRSPLLATWMITNGRLEKTGEELELSVRELVHDVADWPNGHVVIRQRESDLLLEQLRAFEGRDLAKPDRKKRLEIKDALRVRVNAETNARRGLDLLLRDPDLSIWKLKLWREELSSTIESYINYQVFPQKERPDFSEMYLQMSPAGDPTRRRSERLSRDDLAMIQAIMKKRYERYGNTATDTVGELPSDIRARVAVPRLIRGILEYVDEDRLSWEQIRQMKALDFPAWTVSVA